MGKAVALLFVMVLAVIVEGRETNQTQWPDWPSSSGSPDLQTFNVRNIFMTSDWRFQSVKRMKRGYNSGFGSDSTYGQSDEQNASISREGLNGCSGEGDRGYSSSRERLGYNRDGRANENRNGHRSITKSSASASASAFAQNHNLAV